MLIVYERIPLKQLTNPRMVCLCCQLNAHNVRPLERSPLSGQEASNAKNIHVTVTKPQEETVEVSSLTELIIMSNGFAIKSFRTLATIR